MQVGNAVEMQVGNAVEMQVGNAVGNAGRKCRRNAGRKCSRNAGRECSRNASFQCFCFVVGFYAVHVSSKKHFKFIHVRLVARMHYFVRWTPMASMCHLRIILS